MWDAFKGPARGKDFSKFTARSARGMKDARHDVAPSGQLGALLSALSECGAVVELTARSGGSRVLPQLGPAGRGGACSHI